MKLKKVISLFLCICMLTTLLPGVAFAEEDEVRYDEDKCPPHDYVPAVTEATCQHGGYTVYTCSQCGDSYTADETAPLPHTPVTENGVPVAVQVVEPNCQRQGYSVYTCAVCGAEYRGDFTGPLAHTRRELEKVPAACGQPGREAGADCSVCGAVLEGCEVIPALEHVPQEAEAIPPEIGKPGRTAGHVCSLCGVVLDGCEEIDALEEELAITIEKQPADVTPVEGRASFTVQASVNKGETLFYRWQRLDESDENGAWTDIDGASAASLSFTGLDYAEALAEAMRYGYRCVLTAGELSAVTDAVHILRAPTITASGNCGPDGSDSVTWTLYDNGRLVVSGSGAIKNCGETTPWSAYSDQVVSIEVFSGVTSIGSGAFSGLRSLLSVVLPNSLESIGDGAFGNCSSLYSISLPSSVTSLGAFAFCSTALKSFTFPGVLGEVRRGTFQGCGSLESVTLQEGVTLIDIDAFADCSNLASVTLPQSLTSIAGGAFASDGNLSTVTFLGTETRRGELEGGAWSALNNSCLFNAAWTYLGVDPVEYVTLNRSALTLPLGGVSQLYAMVYPAYATNTNVSWASSNAAVAAVDQNGVVTAVGVGTATITVTTEDGNYTYDCEVTVTAEPVLTTPSDIVLTGLTLSAASVEAGGSVELTAEIVSDATFSDQFFGSVQFRCADNGKTLHAFLNAGNDGKLHGSIAVGPYAFAGSYSVWYAELLYGQGARYRPYACSEKMQNDGVSYYRSFPASCDSLAFTVVNNGPQDSTPPVFVSLSFAETVGSPGILEVVLAANDDVSGVSGGYISFRCEESGMSLGVELSPDENGDLRGRLSISPYMAGSVYAFQSAVLFDAAGNSRQLDASALGPNDSRSFTLVQAYTITVSCTGPGTVRTSADHENGSFALPGEPVFAEAVPATGFVLKEGSLAASTVGGIPVEITDGSFVMPEDDVILTAEFVSAPAAFGVYATPSDIAVEKTQYTYGETIDLSFRVSGPFAPDAYEAIAILYGPQDDTFAVPFEYDRAQHRYAASQYVVTDFLPGSWIIGELLLSVNGGDSFVFINQDLYSPDDESGFCYFDLSGGSFSVVGSPPLGSHVITDLAVEKPTYSFGETLKLSFKLSNVASGEEAQLFILGPDGNVYTYTSFAYNSKTGAYEISEYVTNEWPAGNYSVAVIMVTDENGNAYRYWNSAIPELFEGSTKPHTFVDLSAGNFTVTGTPPTGSYKISNLTIKNASCLRGKEILVKFKLSGKNIRTVNLHAIGPDGEWYELGPAGYNKSTKLYERDAYIYGEYPAGDWRIGMISVEDRDGNVFRYYNSELQPLFADSAATMTFIDMGAGHFTVQNSYVVIFNPRRGTGGAMAEQYYLYGESYTLPKNAFVNAGYTFTGWNTEPDGFGTPKAECAEVRDLGNLSEDNFVVLFAQWAPTKYTITYNLNGGTNSPANQDGYTVESPEIVLEDPVREGYRFAGWYKDKNFKQRVTSIPSGSTGNRTLYAKWAANKYTVVYDANGGTGTMKNQAMVYGKAAALTANAFSKLGWHFVGWSEDPNAAVPTYTNKQKVVNLTAANGGIVTLYAVWVKNTYRIVLNANGGTGDMSEESAWCEYDGSYTLPKCTFTRPGFEFLGWATSAKGGVVYLDEAQIDKLSAANGKVVNLYAKWRAYHYDIEFDANGGSGTMKELHNLTCGKVYTLTANAFRKTGYRFTGWNTQPDGSGTMYANKAKVSNLAGGDDDHVTLYAQWELIEYKITYKGVVETDGNLNPPSYTYESPEIVLQPLARPGNDERLNNIHFDGWYLDAKFKKPVEKIEAGSTGAKTLYAKWSGVANSYSVEFDANGGSGTMAPEAMTCGKPRALTANAFKRVGYDFAGWRDGEGNEYDNKEIVLNLSETDGGVVTLYAQWTPAEYKVTYKGLCVFDANPNPAIYTVKDPVDFNHLDDPVRPGCVFGGWYTDAKCTKPAATATFSATGNKTFYAKWLTKVTYTVRFDANAEGVKGSMKPMTKRVNGTVFTLTANAFKRAGYRFTGWNTKADGSGTPCDNKEKVANLAAANGEVVTLYAQWEPVSYAITYKNVAGARIPAKDRYTILEAYDLPVPEKEGYVFLGWYTTANFKAGTEIDTIGPGATGAKTLYAKWMLTPGV